MDSVTKTSKKMVKGKYIAIVNGKVKEDNNSRQK